MEYKTKHEQFKHMTYRNLWECSCSINTLSDWDMDNMELLEVWDMILDEMYYRESLILDRQYLETII